MKILHISSGFSPLAGGAGTSVKMTVEALAANSLAVQLFTTRIRGESLFQSSAVPTTCFDVNFLAKWRYAPSIRSALEQVMPQADIVHLNDIWLYPEVVSSLAALKHKVPYVVSVRGLLHPKALNYNEFRKMLFYRLFGKNVLEKAAMIHVQSENELEAVRLIGLSNPATIIPNGVLKATIDNLPEAMSLESLYPETKGKLKIVYLGRIHPSKGLDILADSLKLILQKGLDVSLIIAGAGEAKHVQWFSSIINNAGLESNVIFTGHLQESDKLSLLLACDIFVMPSLFEAFSNSVLEAMMCGLPVIITSCCNFPEVKYCQAGIVIEPDYHQLSDAIIELAENPTLREQMGVNARALLARKYTWDVIAGEFINMYRVVLAK